MEILLSLALAISLFLNAYVYRQLGEANRTGADATGRLANLVGVIHEGQTDVVKQAVLDELINQGHEREQIIRLMQQQFPRLRGTIIGEMFDKWHSQATS